MASQTIRIFGGKYFLRLTFDVLDYVGGVYGFDVSDDDGVFLFHVDTEDKDLVKSEIAWRVYRSII